MENNLNAGIELGNMVEPARVIIMTVTEHRRVERGQVNVQSVGVLWEGRSLPAVEDDLPAVSLDQGRKPVLRNQPLSWHYVVINKNSNTDRLRCGVHKCSPSGIQESFSNAPSLIRPQEASLVPPVQVLSIT